MRDFFSQAFQPNQQGETNAFGSNPNTLSLAGLLQAQGVPQDKAYIMAAGINNERQVNQAQQQKLAYDQNQQMQRMQALQGLQGLSQGGDVDQNMLNQQLFSGAFSPGEISSLRDVLNPQPKENVVFNPVTGEALLKQIKDGKVTGFSPLQGGISQQGGVFANSGNEMQSKPYETPVEAKERRAVENEELKTAKADQKRASSELTSINSLEKLVDKLDQRRILKEGVLAPAADLVGSYSKSIFNNDLGRDLPSVERFKELSNNLLLDGDKLKNLGSGTGFSDNDRKFLAETLPNDANSHQGNRNILKAKKIKAVVDEKKAVLKQKYHDKFGGLVGFDSRWSDISESNSLLKPSKDGFDLNKEGLRNLEKAMLDPSFSPKASNSKMTPEQLNSFAQDAINQGADPAAVEMRIRQLMSEYQ